MRISTREFEETLQTRLLTGLDLLATDVRNEQDYSRLRAKAMNWQTMNFIFLRGAMRDVRRATSYRDLFLAPDARDLTLGERLRTLKESLTRQLHDLRTLTGMSLEAGSGMDDRRVTAA